MARYDYKCRECNRVVEEIRPMSASSKPGKCTCGGKTDRIFSGDVSIVIVG